MTEIRPPAEDAILEAGFAVFSANTGASIADVAAHAGVGRATLHRYYPSRDALLNALAKAALQELDVAVQRATAEATSYMEGLEMALAAILPLANRQMFLAVADFEADTDLQAAYAKDRADLLNDFEQAKREGGFNPTTPTPWLVEAYEHLIYAGWKLVQDGEATPKQAAALAWHTFTQGAGA